MPSTLLVTNDFGPRAGGIETFVIGLLERIPAGEVIVYTSKQADSAAYDERWLKDFKVKVIRDRSTILLPTPRVIRNLREVIRSEELTRVWFGAAAPLALASRWLRSAGIKHSVALTHGHEVWWSKIWPFSWAMREIGKSVDRTTYLGEFTRSAISPRFKNPEKLLKIAPGIDTDHFAPRDATELRRRHGLEEKAVIISVGRLVHRKGQDRLVEAMAEIVRKVPHAKLVFVGEGPHRKELDRLVAQHQLKDHVIFIGRINYQELPEYISMGDVFAMPSRSRLMGLEVEGLGIVYLEASACGLPVIGGASGGAPDAVIDGVTGYVVDGNDLSAIAHRTVELLDSPITREKMGRAGRSWVIENWRWEIWSQEFNKALEIRL